MILVNAVVPALRLLRFLLCKKRAVSSFVIDLIVTYSRILDILHAICCLYRLDYMIRYTNNTNIQRFSESFYSFFKSCYSSRWGVCVFCCQLRSTLIVKLSVINLHTVATYMLYFVKPPTHAFYFGKWYLVLLRVYQSDHKDLVKIVW